MFSLLSLATQKRFQQQRAEQRLRFEKDSLQDWDEDKTKFAKQLALRASSYSPARLFPSEPITHAQIRDGKKAHCLRVSPKNSMIYANAVLTARTPLDLYQGDKRGEVWFDDEVAIPTLYSGGVGKGSASVRDVWMSVTPAEALSQRQGIRLAVGKVVLGGLGLGWSLEKILAKPSVKEVLVVEINQDIMDWYGADMCARLSDKYKKPVTFRVDDALAHLGKHGTDTRYIYDVWADYPNYIGFLSKEWRAAIAATKHFWGWGVTQTYPRDEKRESLWGW